jgi:hypothetical protein
VAIIMVVVEVCFLRHRRQERALQRAGNDIEHGLNKENEVIMVLESRVSIVVVDEDEEDDEGDETDEEERGRHGFSLPQRDRYREGV